MKHTTLILHETFRTGTAEERRRQFRAEMEQYILRNLENPPQPGT